MLYYNPRKYKSLANRTQAALNRAHLLEHLADIAGRGPLLLTYVDAYEEAERLTHELFRATAAKVLSELPSRKGRR